MNANTNRKFLQPEVLIPVMTEMIVRNRVKTSYMCMARKADQTIFFLHEFKVLSEFFFLVIESLFKSGKIWVYVMTE